MLATSAAHAAFGDTDTTFGTTDAAPGFTITDLGSAADQGQDVVTGLGDRLYALGSRPLAGDATKVMLVVTRYTKDGALDTSFASGGKLELGPLAAPASAYHFDVKDAADFADGRIYLASAGCDDTGCNIGVARIKFDGTLDRSYGTDGFARLTGAGSNPAVNQLLVLPNGALLVLFQHAGEGGVGNRIVVAGLAEDGTPETNFGDNGRIDVSVGACDALPFMTLGRPAVKLYVTAATRATCADTPVPAVTRLDSNGLDSGFGTGGHVVGNFGFAQDTFALVAQDQIDGGIAYALANFGSGVLHVDIIGLNDNGTRDPSVATQSGDYNPVGQFKVGGRAFQTTGKLVFNGTWQTTAENADQAVTRIAGSALLVHAPRFATDVQAQPPTVGFVNASDAVPESAGTYTVTVTLSRTTKKEVHVPFTLGGSATRGFDYTISANEFVIAPNQPSGSVTVTILNDTAEEADEAILFTLGTPQNASGTGDFFDTFILDIEDDDLHVTPPPVTGDGGGALDWLLLSGLLGLAGLRGLRRR